MKHSRGFTLIEIMVAVLIAAILATMAFTAMQQALANRDRVRDGEARLRAVQYTMRSLVQDFAQLQPRPVRPPVGEGGYLAALEADPSISEVTLTRGGWMNPVGLSRSTLQRVRYVLRDEVLYREYWTALDATLEPQPVSRQLLDHVKRFQVRYLNDGLQWQDNWPPITVTETGAEREFRWRPLAVEITLELEDYGQLVRLIEVAG